MTKLDPMDEIASAADFRRALDDAAAIESANRIRNRRLVAATVGAAAGLFLTVLVLKIRG